MNERLRVGLLLAVVMLVYGNTLRNEFTQDDGLYVFNNPQVTHTSLRQVFEPNKFSNVFRPVTFATLAMNWKVNGAQPFAYHLINTLLHAGVTLLLYFLLLEILGSSPHAKSWALVAACLFAVHPLHTEAVASIVGRSELLAAGFLIAAWILHLHDREVPALICFALALLSKESAAVFLPLVLVGDYARGAWKPNSRYLRIAGITLLYVGLLWKIQGGRFGQAGINVADNPLVTIPTGWRILNALRVAWKYVGLHFYPATLSSDYSFNQIPVYLDWRHTLPAALAAAAVVGTWIWAIRKKQSGLVLAGGIYLIGFAITANILIPTGTIMAERLAYLPSAGFCLLVAMGWTWLKERQRMVALGLLAVVVAALAVRTVVRNADWKNDLSIYSAGVRAAPRSAKVHANLGTQYLTHGQLDAARSELETSLQISPDSPDTMASYSLLESKLGHYEAAGALMEKAVQMSGRNDPNYDFMDVSLALLLLRTGHTGDAMEILNREIAESPEYARAWVSRGVVYYQRGDLVSARADAGTALRLEPDNPEAQKLMLVLIGAPPIAAVR
jgi:Tfp pilus assembly protein PilF